MAEGIVDRYESGGYWYNRVTENWKTLCQVLPCSPQLHWPGYRTEPRKFVHKNTKYVVQLWKGHCQKYFNDQTFPGGYGAEVGIYAWGAGTKEGALGKPRGLWLPAVPAPFKIKFRMYYKESGFRKGNEEYSFGPHTEDTKTYWQTQWMEADSYEKFLKDVKPRKVPYVMNMTLRYWIDGQQQPDY
ncbi:MAG: hypothetical protein R3325_04095 [Thermoanaerobaculia bacterium]|nr:hypothetical protein [Thermoanaerobaculia bacterium]